MRKITYAVAGSGWRSLFYWRIAQAYPELFEMKAMVCRTKEKAEKMRREYGVAAVTTEEACEALNPDFIVVAVNKASIADVALHWAQKGYPVLMETPAAMDVETLKKLWEAYRSGARMQVAEQYSFYPMHAAAIELIRRGYIGNPYAIDISTVHDYHAASLIRSYLNTGLAPVCIAGQEYFFPVEETDSRYGAVTDGTVKERRRVRASFAYETVPGQPSKKYAFYDFDGVQYHSFIRSRHINVKGQTGELDDTTLRYVDRNHLPHKLELVPEYDGNNQEKIIRIRLGGDVLYENPFYKMGQTEILPDDETAIATMLLGMQACIRDGSEVYPFAQALEDAYIRILMEEAAASGGAVHSEKMPWN